MHVAKDPAQILLVIVLFFSTRFQLEANITQEMAQQMKKFVLGISDVEIKYRVASQMGFRDVIESLLNGPELPYHTIEGHYFFWAVIQHSLVEIHHFGGTY